MIQLFTENRIAILKIDIGKGNSFTQIDLLVLSDKLNLIESSFDIDGIILTGSNHSFSNGGNLDFILNLKSEIEITNYFRLMDKVLIQLFSFPKPVITALNGHAIGFGFLLSQCADFILTINNDKIKIGLPEIKIGMTIDAVMQEILKFNNISGKTLAKILYFGELYNVNQALDLGLVDQIINESELMEKSILLIDKLINNNLLAFATNKNLLRKTFLNSTINIFEKEKYDDFISLLKLKMQ